MLLFLLLKLVLLLYTCNVNSYHNQKINYKVNFRISSSINDDNNIINCNSIRFCGGGIKFWWQAGCAKYILEYMNNNNKKKDYTLIGASAGSLTATLLAMKVDMDKCAEFAILQAKRDNIFQNPLGLGI